MLVLLCVLPCKPTLIVLLLHSDEDTRFMRRLARDTDPVRGRGRTVADVYGAW